MAGAVQARTESTLPSHRMKLDLNCDLGEGEPLARTRSLMRWITSANVACGGHAGNVDTMKSCVRLAKKYRVKLGAHPGPWSRSDFGRGLVGLTPDELELLLLQQVGALERIARADGVRLHHIKLHGSLYHASEDDGSLGRRYVRTVARWWPDAKIYARAGGNVTRWAMRDKVKVWEEAFADRAYCEDGTLLSRNEPGALLADHGEVTERVRELLKSGEIKSISGARVRLFPATLCVHSDTPHSIVIARSVSQLIRERR
jgi:UPF0271 protein